MAEEKKNSGGGSPQKKKSSNSTIIIVVLVVVGLLLLCCCGVVVFLVWGGSMFGQAVEESVEESLEDGEWSYEDEDGGFSYDETTEWPDEISSTVPEFEYGEISSVSSVDSSEDETSWYIYFTELESGGYDDYVDDLENTGWTIDSETTTGGYNYMMASKGDLGVSLSFDISSDYATLSVYSGY